LKEAPRHEAADRVYLRREKSGAWLLMLWVQPNSARSALAGLHGDRLKVRLAAPPLDGKANKELVRFLSRALDVPRKNIEISAGLGARGKTVRIIDPDPDTLGARLP